MAQVSQITIGRQGMIRGWQGISGQVKTDFAGIYLREANNFEF